MIANCPSCGTHYKHEPPKQMVRARCGQCDTAVPLGRLRPYRIVAAVAPTDEQSKRAARHLPIGLDHPALATQIAENVARGKTRDVPQSIPIVQTARPTQHWDDDELLPQIPEMSQREGKASSMRSSAGGTVQAATGKEAGRETPEPEVPQVSAGRGGGKAAFALWLAAGAIAGAAASWTMGGTITLGMAAGAAFGAAAGWVWLRWMSPK